MAAENQKTTEIYDTQTVAVCPAGAGGGEEADPEEEMIRLAMALSLAQHPLHQGTGDENGSVEVFIHGWFTFFLSFFPFLFL